MYIVVMRQVSKTHAYKAKNKMHNLKATQSHSELGVRAGLSHSVRV